MFNCVSNPLSKIFNYLRHIHRGNWDSWASLVAQMVKNLPAMQETWAWFQGQENHLEKRRAFMELCSIKFPSLKCLLNKPTNKYMIIKKKKKKREREKSIQLEYSCLENFMNRGSWWATVHEVAKSWTRMSEGHTCMYVRMQFSSVNENTLCFTLWKTRHLRHPSYWGMLSSVDLAPPCAIFIQVTTWSGTSNLCMWLSFLTWLLLFFFFFIYFY